MILCQEIGQIKLRYSKIFNLKLPRFDCWRSIIIVWMNSFIVVERFDVFNDVVDGLLSRKILFRVNQLSLNDAMKRFNTGVIVTVSFAAHACNHVVFTQNSLVLMWRILTATIWMMNQSFCWFCLPIARFSTRMTSSFVIRWLICQPSILREYKSIIVAKYSQPSFMWIYVMSPTQTFPRASTWNSWFSKFG